VRAHRPLRHRQQPELPQKEARTRMWPEAGGAARTRAALFGHLQGLLTMIKGLPPGPTTQKISRKDKEALFDVVRTTEAFAFRS